MTQPTTNMDSINNEVQISDFISQAYVLHRTGLVILSRKYAENCIKIDPLLIGGMLSAIITFTTESASKENICRPSSNGRHMLTQIVTTCSTWYIHLQDDLVVALLVPNDSPLLERKNLVQNIGHQILETYILFQQFTIEPDETIQSEDDNEFGNTVDNIVSDVILDLTGIILNFSRKGEVIQFDYSI